MAKKNTDTVPAMLTPGEFVIKRSSARKIGYGKLEKANETGELSHMNKGGKVKTKKKEAKMPQGKGTYGSQVGRPPKKAKGYAKGGKAKKSKGLTGWLQRVVPGGKSGYEEAKPKKMSRKEHAQKIKSSEKYKKAQTKTKKDVQKKVLDPSWKSATTAAKKGGHKLTDLISRRKAAKKGTQAYADAQNKINEYYGVSKRHKAKKQKITGSQAIYGEKGVSLQDELTKKPIKKQLGGRIPQPQTRTGMRPPVAGPARGYSKGGEVTSEGYPVHRGNGNYKVGE